MHCVAGHGFYDEAIEMAEILVEAGADVNARSATYGLVPLHVVRTTGMIDFLLRSGADPSIKSDSGLTPEEYLAEDDYNEESEYLKQKTKEG